MTEEQNIETALANEDVKTTLERTMQQLERFKGDGKTIHNLNSCKGRMLGTFFSYNDATFPPETFNELNQRDPERYSIVIRALAESIEKYGCKL